ncbi:hypothetical protein RSWS8N_06230 [Cereibacter sphaeroides WS8N]|uniref:hypothetical protein n=1 Tax=Cereibacter sphaeroides TaxID=1063 RepID=UPI00020DF448|nr:hypothetical protein [Cereibacter sphaeroides]EGJ21658.1 hypothetical protein RSWS8N_06230 [Cereibacter sphaeroides WS8N]
MSERPYYKLCGAISIVQAHILASDTVLDPEKVFGTHHLPIDALELAARELADLLGDLAELEERRQADAEKKAAA